jgi:hypothetical protein
MSWEFLKDIFYLIFTNQKHLKKIKMNNLNLNKKTGTIRGIVPSTFAGVNMLYKDNDHS